MSKKDKIKKYLWEHKKDIIRLGLFEIVLTGVYFIGADSGMRSAFKAILDGANEYNATNNNSERFEVVGNIIKGFKVDKIET